MSSREKAKKIAEMSDEVNVRVEEAIKSIMKTAQDGKFGFRYMHDRKFMDFEDGSSLIAVRLREEPHNFDVDDTVDADNRRHNFRSINIDWN